MTHNLYALLVGIDNYPPGLSSLSGCANDIGAFSEYLDKHRAHEFESHRLILLNQQATRQRIIEGFRSHLCRATEQDVALFYFSGHGSQEPTPPEFWHLEPDRLNETIVCWDSRTKGGWDLADKELSKLIAEVSSASPHIVIILDSCHAADATREPQERMGARYVPPDERHRPLDSYICSPKDPPIFRDVAATPVGRLDLHGGKHVLLAACRENQLAKEYATKGGPQGVFSYSLLEALRTSGSTLSYRDLEKSASALVRRNVMDQSPQLEATDLLDLDRPFLGGAVSGRRVCYTISFDNDLNWTVDAGAVHGVSRPSARGTARFALFPIGTPMCDMTQLSSAVGWAEVTEVHPHLSHVKLVGIEAPDVNAVLSAVLIELPEPAIGVKLEGDEFGVRLAREAIGPSGSTGLASRRETSIAGHEG
jgi:hypothetical protein